MTIYGYQCRKCGLEEDSTIRAATLGGCPGLDWETNEYCGGELRRKYSVRTNAVIHSHFNSTTGTMVSGNRNFDEQMKRESERVSEYTGMEHRFERVDPSNRDALGVTDQGIDESNRIRKQQGLPTFKT